MLHESVPGKQRDPFQMIIMQPLFLGCSGLGIPPLYGVQALRIALSYAQTPNERPRQLWHSGDDHLDPCSLRQTVIADFSTSYTFSCACNRAGVDNLHDLTFHSFTML